MSEARVIDSSEAEIFEDHGLISRRLVRRAHGSNGMSFNVSTLHEGYDDQDVVYPDHDEIVYMLTGTVEVTIAGRTQTVTAGQAVFVPRGARYGYKVVKGPNDVIAVFSPAKA